MRQSPRRIETLAVFSICLAITLVGCNNNKSSTAVKKTVVSSLPQLLPGATCVQATSVLGAPTEEDQHLIAWETPEFRTTAGKDSRCFLTEIYVQIHSGRKASTSDGINLGVTTVGEAEQIRRSRLNGESEVLEAPEGNWVALIVIAPQKEFPSQTTYRAFISPEALDRMGRDPVFSDYRGAAISQYSVER